jgi:D-3-phosphoglycerate dehydrogenase / 2-oxoglutarate reductase
MTQPELKCLLLENIHASALEIFKNAGFRIETLPRALKEDELIAEIKGVQVLGIRSKTRITPKVLEAAGDLLAIGAFCIGTNQIALEAAHKHGVPVFNAPFSNTRSVAELVIAEVVSLARQLTDRTREVHEGKWRKIATNCYEVRGKKLGIVGYGHIGSQVGVLAEAMGMRVISHDIRSTLPMGNNSAVSSLEELLGEADFVTIHVPETPQTKNLFGEKQIAAMKKGSYLINASRGTVVDLDALAAGLKSGQVGGAAVDVYPEEPEGNDDGFKSPLQGLPNVILTPHIGGSTVEAQAAIGREVANSLVKFAQTGATTGAVNFPHLELPLRSGAHRILNVHKNVPGVLRDINRIVSDNSANIEAQLLGTDPEIGYLVMDIHEDVSLDVLREISALKTSIRTRIVYGA